MLEKLKNRFEKIRDQGQKIISDGLSKKVSKKIQEERYSICQSCEKLYRPSDTCRVCGCFMKVKTWMPNQSCPLKKWSAVESEQSE